MLCDVTKQFLHIFSHHLSTAFFSPALLKCDPTKVQTMVLIYHFFRYDLQLTIILDQKARSEQRTEKYFIGLFSKLPKSELIENESTYEISN